MSVKKSWREVYKSDYLASWDIDDGETLILTIKSVKEEECNIMAKTKDEKIKVVAYFEEKGHRPMIVNPTNCKIMQKLTGCRYFEDWAGTRIEVYCEEKNTKSGEKKFGLSIKKELPKQKEVLNENHPKWNSAIKAIKAGSVSIDWARSKYIITKKIEEKLLSNIENK